MAGRGVGAAVKAHENISIPRSNPFFVAVAAVDESGGSFTLNLPGTFLPGDLLLILLESEGADPVMATPTGFTLLSTGTDAAPPITRLTAYWKIAVAGETNPVTIPDSGDHQNGAIACFRGVHPTSPIEAFLAGTGSGSAVTIAGVTTLGANRLIVVAASDSTDANTDNAVWSGFTNANLTSITEFLDYQRLAGSGGGIGAAWGIKPTTGAVGNTTATGPGGDHAQLCIAIKGFP